MIQIILKSGFIINVNSDLEEVKKIILDEEDVLSIGNSFILVKEIAAVVTPS